MIPLTQCRHRYLYRIGSRNLSLGVFDRGQNGFVGIREKFDDLYLFVEYHWDCGPPYGTVNPLEELECIPETFSLAPRGPTYDRVTKRLVEWDKERLWFFIDTGESSSAIRPVSSINRDLFNYLHARELELGLRSPASPEPSQEPPEE